MDNRIVPGQRIDAINRFYQRIDGLEAQSHREIKQRLADAQIGLDGSAAPLKQLAAQRVGTGMEKWKVASAQLAALSPIATLARGYSVCQRESGEVITDASQAGDGETLGVRLRRGALTCQVVERSMESAE